MSSHKLENYLRTYRKRLGLTQNEVSYLLGCRSGAKVSNYERFARQPNLKTALAYEVILAVPVRELFAGTCERVERQVRPRMRTLLSKLSKAAGSDPLAAHRLEALGRFAAR